MNEPHIWWYVTRASALIAWVLMTASVLWGILLSTRVMRKVDNPAWLQDLHRYLGGVMLIMVALHMVSLMLDPWLKFTIVEELVPFGTDFKPLPIALGIIAMYLLVAVQGSSLIMNRLPRKFWKGLHYSSYAALLLVALHAGWSGTDTSTWWYRALAIVLIAVATIAVLVRVIVGTRFKGGGTTAAPQPAADAPARVEVNLAPAGARTMVVTSVTTIADRVLGIRLVPLGGGTLPVWQPGAHITLHLPNGLERQYSLCGDPAEREHYDVAVLHTEESEGGSEWIHTSLKAGVTLEVTGPHNHFELEPAAEYLFIAGGIGITPIMAMIESLPAKRAWRLIYLGRSRKHMAFVNELEQRYPDRVRVVAADDKKAKAGFSLADVSVTANEQVYCCGPEALMEAVAEVVPADRMHLERFVPLLRESASPAGEVTLFLRKSKKELLVPADESLLLAMERAGAPIVGSCNKGVCGTCEVRVISGRPVHLDSVMDDAQKDALHIMYPCVSRATGDPLTLDI